MWNKNVAYIVIHPQRYTKEFVDNSDSFSLTFFDESYRETLSYLGTKSGRDEDKLEKSKLAVLHENNTPYFKETNIAISAKKLFAQEYKPESFIDNEFNQKMYPYSDHHTLYIGEITKILIKE